MRLKSLMIQNYRSCLRTTMDLHPNLSVLIGPNSSGKTNILQAIMLLRKMARAERGHSLRGGVGVTSRLKATFHEGHTSSQLNAWVDAYTDESNNDVMVESRQKWSVERPKGKHTSLQVPLSFVGGIGTSSMYRRVLGGSEREYRLYMHRALALESVPNQSLKPILYALRRVANYCAGIMYYGASQFTNPGTCPASFEIEREGRLLGLGRRGHVKILYNMYSAQKNSSNARYKQFIDIVGPRGLRLIDDLKFREVPTSSVHYSVRVGGKVERRKRKKLLVIPQFKIGEQMLSPNQLSEGTFKTLALLFHVVAEESTMLLIEEPEVCIHHGLLSSILELIKVSSRHKQMVLSTHSDYVLDHVDPGNVYRVAFDRSAGTVVRQIEKTMTPKEYSALREYLDQEGNLGEYWREGGLGDRP